jgi:hypothetical protein
VRPAAGRVAAASTAGTLCAVALALAACGTPPATASPSGVAVPSAPASAAVASAVARSPASASASGGKAVALDESLLAILPPDLDGSPVRPEPDAFGEAARDPDFTRNVESAAFAVVVDQDDLASGVVARLRPGVFDDGLFRDWRDTYNEGACAQAGGVSGNAEAEIGGRTVYIGTCAADVRVYHAWLPERGVIVSLFSLGPQRFGERLMDGLRP